MRQNSSTKTYVKQNRAENIYFICRILKRCIRRTFGVFAVNRRHDKWNIWLPEKIKFSLRFRRVDRIPTPNDANIFDSKIYGSTTDDSFGADELFSATKFYYKNSAFGSCAWKSFYVTTTMRSPFGPSDHNSSVREFRRGNSTPCPCQHQTHSHTHFFVGPLGNSTLLIDCAPALHATLHFFCSANINWKRFRWQRQVHFGAE